MKSANSNNEQKKVPFSTIKKAVNGDTDAIYDILQHYDKYILSYSTRYYCDEKGNSYHGVDWEIYARMQAKLMQAILLFRF
ncbi:MAG: helix-turn-helix domain-containing protein [Clostridiales bacterium]|nr:helix-turn-helix domain-containing protein [Clostridiales bacterium]